MTQLLLHTFAHLTGHSFRLRPNYCQQMKVFWSYINLHKSCWKLENSDIQSQFSTSKIIQILLKKIFIEEYQFKANFLLLTFFTTSIFKALYFLKWWSEFTQVNLISKKILMGSSLAFSLQEDPVLVRCAKVCDESWVILKLLSLLYNIVFV